MQIAMYCLELDQGELKCLQGKENIICFTVPGKLFVF